MKSMRLANDWPRSLLLGCARIVHWALCRASGRHRRRRTRCRVAMSFASVCSCHQAGASSESRAVKEAMEALPAAARGLTRKAVLPVVRPLGEAGHVRAAELVNEI